MSIHRHPSRRVFIAGAAAATAALTGGRATAAETFPSSAGRIRLDRSQADSSIHGDLFSFLRAACS